MKKIYKEKVVRSLRDREIAKFRWTMLGPGLLILLLINLLPIADTLYTSFFDTYLPFPQDDKFVGFDNYLNLFKDARFLASTGRTVAFMLMVLITEIVIGFGIAISLTSSIKGSKILRGLFLLPIILTPIATAFMWRIMFSPTLGILNFFLETLGIAPQEWIYSPDQALSSVAIVVAWCKMPFMIMVFYTGLLSISEDVIDSCKIDGASAWQQLWKIKLPLMKKVFFVAVLFQTVDTAKEFDLTFILTRGGPGSATESLSVYTYLNSFGFLKMGYGSASAVLLSILIICLAAIIIKFGGINFDE
ncbi:MAG: sugar ABC transporter permease [Spirochaetales bacterium]